MSILSLITLTGASAFGLLAQRWDGRLGGFDATMNNAKNIMLVQDVLSSLVPYVAYNGSGQPVIYFEGNRNGFVAVSSKSIYSYGDFAVVRFSVRQNSDLSFDLIYEESPMSNAVLTTLNQELSFTRPLTLFKSVNDPTFSYFGWANAGDRYVAGDEFDLSPPAWHGNFNGVEALFAPLKAKLIFSNEDGEYTVLATLSTEVSGLLRRYKSGAFDDASATPVNRVDDDCQC